MNGHRHLIFFLLLNFGLSVLLSTIILLTGGHNSGYIQLGYISMFIPAFAVFVMKLAFNNTTGSVGWNKFPIKWIPAALFIMPVAIHIICIPLIMFLNNGTIPWQSWLYPDADGLYHAPAEKKWGILTSGALTLRIVLNATTGIFIMTILVFFEEIGWRVWLFSRLGRTFSLKKTILIGAVIWALWHMPYDLSGIHYIEGIPRFQMVVVNLLGYIGAGIIIGWLWVKSNSIWIVCLAHASLNNWGQYAFKYMEDAEHIRVLHLYLNLILLILGLIIYASIRTNSPQIVNYVKMRSNKKLNSEF